MRLCRVAPGPVGFWIWSNPAPEQAQMTAPCDLRPPVSRPWDAECSHPDMFNTQDLGDHGRKQLRFDAMDREDCRRLGFRDATHNFHK